MIAWRARRAVHERREDMVRAGLYAPRDQACWMSMVFYKPGK